MIIAGYSAERRVSKSGLPGEKNPNSYTNKIEKTSKERLFCKHCFHVNPVSDVSDPVLFAFEVLDCPVQLFSAQHWRKLNIDPTCLFMIFCGH